MGKKCKSDKNGDAYRISVPANMRSMTNAEKQNISVGDIVWVGYMDGNPEKVIVFKLIKKGKKLISFDGLTAFNLKDYGGCVGFNEEQLLMEYNTKPKVNVLSFL